MTNQAVATMFLEVKGDTGFYRIPMSDISKLDTTSQPGDVLISRVSTGTIQVYPIADYVAPVVAAPVAAPVATPAPTVPATPIAPAMLEPMELTVGPGKQFTRITAAMEKVASRVWEANNGSYPRPAQLDLTVTADVGIYENDWASGFGGTPQPVAGTPFEQVLGCKFTLRKNPAQSGLVKLLMSDTGSLYYGKAPFVTTDKDASFQGLHFVSTVPNWQGENWCGVRIDGSGPMSGNFLFEDCEFEGWADGVLGGNPGQTIVFRRVYTHDNGTGDGLTHNAYCNHFDTVLIDTCLSAGAKVGHLWKSRGLKTTIRIRYGVDERDIWTDNASGRNMKRPGWQGLWKDIQPGDTVVVLAIDRLGRNLVEVVTTVDAMRARGVGLKVLNGDIDTSTPMGRLLLGIFASLAEYERFLITERSQHGLDKARERGVIGGRPRKLTVEVLDAAIVRVNGGETQEQVAASLGVHRNSLAKAMTKRRHALRYEKGEKK